MVRGSISPKVKERDRRIYEEICALARKTGRFPTVRELMSRVGVSSPSMVQGSLDRLEEQGLIARQGKRRCLPYHPHGVAVPVLGTIAAGVPIMAEEVIDGYVHIPPAMAKSKELFALKVRGDSMIGAGILEQDTVILEKTDRVEDGEIAAVWLEDAATVKRVYREKNALRLMPENPAYQPIVSDKCIILGKVIGLVRNYE